MKQIKSILKLLLVFAAMTSLLFSCNLGNNDPTENNTETETEESNSEPEETSSYEENASERNIATDDSESFEFTNTVYINLSTPAFSADNTEWTDMTSEAATIMKDSDGNKITTAYDSTTGAITITSKKSEQTLLVEITGNTDSAHIFFENAKNVTLGVKLNNAAITSSGNYPAISFDKKATVYLYAEGTNSITDGRKYGYGYGPEYSDSAEDTYTNDDDETENCTVSKNPVSDGEDTKGTIYSKGPILLTGSGTLTLTEGYKHGIYSKDYIRVFDGNWNITTTGRNGIQSVNGFIMDGGNITIKGTGSYTNNQSRGIIVEGEENEDYPGEGFILINDGTINITTVSKAISAKWDIDEDAETTDTADDPYPYVKITGGTITVKTTGKPADESSKTYTFIDADGVSVTETTKLSPEGIEGKESVFIEGGKIDVQTTDDCINASRSGYAVLKISGGEVYAYSSDNDALDSNGTLTIEGGTIVALTATTPECAFDCDNYTFSITGGTLIGIGTTNYSKPTASACTQSTVVLSGDYLGTAGKTFVIGESATEPVFAYTLDSSIFSKMSSSYVAIISSPAIKQDTTYSLYADSTVSGGEAFNGLYTTLPTASDGTSKASSIKTTSSSTVYTLSSSKNGGAQEGEHGNPEDGTQKGGQKPGFGF